MAEGRQAAQSMISMSDPRVVVSSFYRESESFLLRFVNYSGETVNDLRIIMANEVKTAHLVDFNGNREERADIIRNQGTTPLLTEAIKPWEILTIELRMVE